MVYNDGLVVVVKSRGKVMREDKDKIYLPYGSEYSLLFKNLNSKKVLVSVSIDGQDVLNGHKMIINPNSEVELERFVENLDKGNRFKFIQKTQKIVDNRGDRLDDGMIRVEYWFEKSVYVPPVIYRSPVYVNTVYTTSDYSYSICRDNTLGISGNCFNSVTNTVNSSVNADNVSDNIASDEGITVKGSESGQGFSYGYIGTVEENSKVIVLLLKGYRNDTEVVKEPITVDKKFKCKTCGTTNKSNSKYCRECGTFLD